MRTHGRRRLAELAVLALGLGAAAGLALAALVGLGDPEALGRARLAQAAGEVEDLARAEWERLRADPDALAAARLLEPVRFAGELRAPAAPVAGVALPDEPRSRTFDVLLRDAERKELTGKDAAEALTDVLDALAGEPSPAQRAEGRLRAIQLAARTGDAAVVREQLALLRDELDGAAARGGTSIELLAVLAAAPALDASERLELLQELTPAWVAGRLALPGAAPRVAIEGGAARWELPALRLALWDRLLSALGDPVATGILRAGDDETTRLRRAALLALASTLDGDWTAVEGSATPLAIAPERSGSEWELALLDLGRLAATLRERLAAARALEGGFALAFDGESPGAEVLRGRTPLEGGVLGFRVAHADPESVVAEEGARQRALRVGLLALALLAALAGLAAFRALRRERALADAKAAFVANVSHELRTPLSSILLMAENLEEGRVADPERAKRYPTLIRREAQRLRRLVDDVLDFSRLERGERPRLRAEETALSPLAAELEREVRDRVEAAGGELRFATGADLPEQATLDAEALRRCALNLVDNALRHSGSTAVEVELAREGGDLCLRVRDRGRGVPAARREEVFRPFARLSEGNGAATGTGLGLAIVREVARAHGGSATLREPGDGPGTLAEVRIPLDGTQAGQEGA